MQTPKNMNVQAEQSVAGTTASTSAPSTTAPAAAAHFFCSIQARIVFQTFLALRRLSSPRPCTLRSSLTSFEPVCFLSRAPSGTVGPYTTRVGAGMDTYQSHLRNTTPFQVCSSSG